jgi:hypothetical protein
VNAFGLVLPSRLQAAAGEPRREPISRADTLGGATVTIDRVDMGRQGWRYELNVERRIREAGELVQLRDTLWLLTFVDARRLELAAIDALAAAALEPRGGLSRLAHELHIPVPER